MVGHVSLPTNVNFFLFYGPECMTFYLAEIYNTCLSGPGFCASKSAFVYYLIGLCVRYELDEK